MTRHHFKSGFRQLSPLFTPCIGALLIAAPLTTLAETQRDEAMVRMRDGVMLNSDLYRPSGVGPWPVIVARTPYNKRSSGSLGTNGVERGYAVVIQDVRGRFSSQGANIPFDRDIEDGSDTLKWISQQAWCNGRIGSVGGSAGAITQLHLAASGAPELTCQHLVVGGPSLYHDIVYTGGIFRKALVEDWLRLSSFAPEALKAWTSHPAYDDYWRARDASIHYAKVHTPAIHVGGYWDIFAQGTIDTFLGYQEHGGLGARGKQKLVMGPWTHGVLQDKAGELTFPNAKKPPGDVHDSWRWFERWLKGVANGADETPTVTYYVIGDTTQGVSAPGNIWRTASTWPPVSTTATAYFLGAQRTLDPTAPPKSSPLSFNFDPSNPAPTLGGVQLTLSAGPVDQRKLDNRPDVLVFTTAPLQKPTEVTGRIHARLWISSTATDTDFFATLCDVYPDGRAFNLCEGRKRMRFRNSLSKEELLNPGQVYPVDLDLWSTSAIFNTGHRIRLQITSSSSPGFDVNPNTGDPFRANSTTVVATNTIHIGGATPSQVVLPIATAP